tara:strand:+ start:6962 stop:7195 length:234 start_codon:yes stop_codon:yes gene_type:complete
MNVYKLGDVSYDVDKLDEEAHGMFALLQQAMINVRQYNDKVQLFQAGATHIKELFEAKLTDEAITEEEDTEVTIKAN